MMPVTRKSWKGEALALSSVTARVTHVSTLREAQSTSLAPYVMRLMEEKVVPQVPFPIPATSLAAWPSAAV
jgi:hypothetical protein